MTWESIDTPEHEPTPEEQNRARQAQEDQAELRRQAYRAFKSPDQKLLREHLMQTALARSYTPGANPADVAHSEGKRAMALYLLSLGEQTHG